MPKAGTVIGDGRVSNCAEQACRKRDERANKIEHATYRDSNQAKRQQQQPHYRVEHQRKQRQRPADHEQNAPQKKLDHIVGAKHPYAPILTFTNEPA